MTAPGNRPSLAHQTIELLASQQRLTDSTVDIDYTALARLDVLPEDQAVAVIDDVMRQLLSD